MTLVKLIFQTISSLKAHCIEFPTFLKAATREMIRRLGQHIHSLIAFTWARATEADRLGSITGRVIHWRLENGSCDLSSLVLRVEGWAQDNGSRSVLRLTCHQCSIHYGSRRETPGGSKRDERRWLLRHSRVSGKASMKLIKRVHILGQEVKDISNRFLHYKIFWDFLAVAQRKLKLSSERHF